MGQEEKDRQTGQIELDRQNRTGRTGGSYLNRQNRTVRTGQANKTSRTVQT